jgi:MYXO-CTERM domain-containing protein
MRRFLAFAFVLSAGTFLPAAARAHFILQAPANWIEQSTAGDPQKTAPCGPGPGEAMTATGMVATLSQGGQVTVTINETVFHPGHYRVALSTTGQAGLPADPPVTPVGTDQCGMKEIMNPPQLPVIADGMLPHTTQFSGPQSFTVQLPPNVTCNANCVLQVTEYMQNHGAPCFYHHCADVVILPPDGTTDAGPLDAGTGGKSDSGCGCAVSAERGSLLGLVAMLMIGAVRRRSSPRPRKGERPTSRRLGG